MKELDLYKFIKENDCEYHWKDDDVILFVNNIDIPEWNKLLGQHILDEDGLQCVMKDGYFCYMMQDICDHFNINMSDVFETDK